MAENPDSSPQLTIITGLSGAGRSEVAKIFEDLGYFVIDNLPPVLIEKLAELVWAPSSKVQNVGLVVDVRGGEFFADLEQALAQLTERGIEYRVLFLEASDETLVRRYEYKRHRHPLAEEGRVTEGILREREMMSRFRAQADVILDTSELSLNDLREKVVSLFGESSNGTALAVNVLSFGYKNGLPLDADVVFDCRFLPNPYWVEELRPLDGTNEEVRRYVLESANAADFLERLEGLLSLLLPGYIREGKHYLTVALGCTGGFHRSVVLANEVALFLRDQGFHATTIHRDIGRE